MTYAVHEDFLEQRIAEAEEVGKQFGNGSAYQDLLAILGQYEARHLEMLRDRNRMMEAAHQEGIRLGEQRERQRVVAHVAQVVEAAAGMGGAPWPVMEAILEKLRGELESGEHVVEEEK